MIATDETFAAVRSVLARTLQLDGKAASLGRSTELLGSLAELDSMAVMQVLTALEEHFGITVADDEVNADTFATLGGLADFIESKLTA
jgi:acyl carrier protein